MIVFACGRSAGGIGRTLIFGARGRGGLTRRHQRPSGGAACRCPGRGGRDLHIPEEPTDRSRAGGSPSLTCLRQSSGGQTIDAPSRTSAATRELVHRFQMNRPYLASVPIRHRALPSATPHPARAAPRWHTHTLFRHPPPRPPAPSRDGAVRGDKALSGSPPGSPRGVDRGDIAMGEGSREKFSPFPQAGTRTFLLKAPAPPEGGSVWGYPGQAVSRDANRRSVCNTIEDLLC